VFKETKNERYLLDLMKLIFYENVKIKLIQYLLKF